METSAELPKKRKRSFVQAWLTDERYKDWIRRVSSDDTSYYCSVCNKSFSCNAAHVSRHADSACHRNNVEETLKLETQRKFRYQWLDIDDFKLWLRDVPHNESLCLCTVCNITFQAHLAHIQRHAESASHINLRKEKNIEASKANDFNTFDKEFPLSFDERKKSAEIRFAAFIAEKNIPLETANEILRFFQDIEDPHVLKNMSMSRPKCKNIICNVICPVEKEHVVRNLRHTKFSIFVDETSDICNEKWLTFFARYVDPETLDIRSQLVKLMNVDARDCSAEKLFHEFQCEMWDLQIPFLNIVALSCDNASVMTGKHLSFKTKLQANCKNLLTFPCPCHSAALAAHAACAKIPSICDDFLRKISSYINSSPKRSAVFRGFCECFQEKYRKILKLSDTRWLSHHTCVERLLDSWDTILHFLQEMVVNEKKAKSAEYLLSLMINVETKAYFLFLKYILNYFNAFNAFFQSTETRIHLLQMKSENFLSDVCQNFIKPEYMKNIADTMDFSQGENKKSTSEIFLGLECEEYLETLTEDYADTVAIVRQNCLQFYVTAAKEIRQRLPINDEFLKKLKVFMPHSSFSHEKREASFENVSFVATTLGGCDERCLKEEWINLPAHFTAEEKERLSKLQFDKMWKEILLTMPNKNYKYPALTTLMSAVRALPNSNADPERTFSILTDLKTKKRNKLSSAYVNAACVLKSALKTRGERAINMKITEQHFDRMTTDKLYAASSKKPTSSFYFL